MYDKHLGKNLVCPMCAHNPAVLVLKVTVSVTSLTCPCQTYVCICRLNRLSACSVWPAVMCPFFQQVLYKPHSSCSYKLCGSL